MKNIDDWVVIVVEDEEDSLQVVSQILSFHGIQIRFARNGLECLELLQTVSPTLIVMDLSMPEMDGWRTLEQIRGDAATAHIPVAAITAYHSVNVAEEALNAGFDAYFAKPIAVESFVQSLASMLDAA